MDPCDVSPDRCLADSEESGNLFLRESLCQLQQHFELPLTQLLQIVSRHCRNKGPGIHRKHIIKQCMKQSAPAENPWYFLQEPRQIRIVFHCCACSQQERLEWTRTDRRGSICRV